ncbi:MAG: hypothetical protein IT294_18060 [Deltaproteobacteria bacterium]|nr:hypothetical protein [Deltaproteobacteria bacterium]
MRISAIAAAFGAALMMVPGGVEAQGVAAGKLDHLVCYEMKDSLTVEALVDLKAELQPEFDQARCRVVKPTKFCVPTTKILLQPGPGPDIVGQPLRDDYVCYLVKCPRGALPPIPAKLVGDQFGRHRQTKYKPVELCVPARKAAVPCARIGTGKQCGGACPVDALGNSTACRLDEASRECRCQPETCGGRPDQNGQCGGICAQQGDVCRPGVDPAGRASCLCQPPPTPECGPNVASGTCGGACPNPADQCVGITTAAGIECKCQPPEPGCQLVPGEGQCAGQCPTGLECVLSSVINDCRCEPTPRECGSNPLTGQCGGLCQPGSVCRFVNDPAAPVCACMTD